MCFEILHFPEYDRSIVASKAERITQCRFHLSLLGLIKGQVKFRVNFRVVCEVVDRGGDKIVLHGQYAGYSLDSARSAQKVPCHTFGRRNIQFGGMVAKYLFNRFQFCDVA